MKYYKLKKVRRAITHPKKQIELKMKMKMKMKTVIKVN